MATNYETTGYGLVEVVVTEVTEPRYSIQFEATKTELLQLASALVYVQQIMPNEEISSKIKGLAETIRSKVGARHFEWEKE